LVLHLSFSPITLRQSVALQSFLSALLSSIALRDTSITRLYDSCKTCRSAPTLFGDQLVATGGGGMRVDFQRAAYLIAAKSLSNAARLVRSMPNWQAAGPCRAPPAQS
jgi:hypothetical protein